MFAERMKVLQPSAIRRMFEMGQMMKNPIDLSLGRPNFDVPVEMKNAMKRAIDEGKNGYTVTAGAPEFLVAVRKYLARENVHPEGVMAIAGGSGGLILALLAMADESCEVLVTDPGFVSYNHFIRLAGSTPRYIDTYPDLKLTPERLRAAVTPKTRILIFNSPVNPTGVAYSPEEIKALAEESRRLGLQVISDEVYDEFCFDFPHECWLKHDSGAVLVRALTKTYGVPGWRCGFAAGPKKIIDQMTMLQQFTFVCMNTPAQYAAIEAFQLDRRAVIADFKRRRDYVYGELSRVFEVVKPQGAFYIFPKAPRGDSAAFLQKCIEHEILVVPGDAFSAKNTHFRVSYAVADDVLQRGVELLIRLARMS